MPDFDFAAGKEVLYRPSDWQARYHAIRVWELLGAGAQGPGKSMCLLNDPIDQIRVEDERCRDKNHPHRIQWGQSTGWALHMRRTKPRLAQTIQRAHRIFPRIDPEVKWNDEDSTFTFRSGFKYQFGHCKDPNSYENYQSNEYTWIGWDELTEFLEEQYENIILRCRSTDPVLGAKRDDGRYEYLRIRSMSNPLARVGLFESEGGIVIRDPHWVRRRFVEKYPAGGKIFKKRFEVAEGEWEIRERLYLPATIDDNPNKEFVRHQKASLMDAKPHIRQAMLYGDWFVSPASHFAEEWDNRVHVVRPYRIPSEWKWIRSMDWGYKVFGIIGWWALSEEGDMVLVEELVFRRTVAEIVAARAKKIEMRLGLWGEKRSRIRGPADRQIFRATGTMAKSIAQTFWECGFDWDEASQEPGSRLSNSILVAERLMDHDEGTQRPGLSLFAHCERTVRTIPSIQSDPDNPEEPMEGGDDHAYDMTAYAVAYVSAGQAGVRVEPKKPKDRDPFEEEEEEERRQERRRKRHGADRYRY